MASRSNRLPSFLAKKLLKKQACVERERDGCAFQGNCRNQLGNKVGFCCMVFLLVGLCAFLLEKIHPVSDDDKMGTVQPCMVNIYIDLFNIKYRKKTNNTP